MSALRHKKAIRRALIAVVVLLIIIVSFLAGIWMHNRSQPNYQEQGPSETKPARPKNQQDPYAKSYRIASLDANHEADEMPASFIKYDPTLNTNFRRIADRYIREVAVMKYPQGTIEAAAVVWRYLCWGQKIRESLYLSKRSR